MQRLQECKQMMDVGLISAEDYEAVKSEVLGLQARSPPPVVVGMAAEPVAGVPAGAPATTRMTLSTGKILAQYPTPSTTKPVPRTRTCLNEHLLTCSSDGLTFQLRHPGSLSVCYTAAANQVNTYLIHAGAASSDPEEACAVVKRCEDSASYTVEVRGAKEPTLQARFTVGSRSGRPSELIIQHPNGCVFENRKPRWDPVRQSFFLEMGGRAKIPSMRNVTMCVAPEAETSEVEVTRRARTVVLQKASVDERLGFSLESHSAEQVAVISQVGEHGAAAGVLYSGDRVVVVNGTVIKGARHAVQLLHQASGSIEIVVLRRSCSTGEEGDAALARQAHASKKPLVFRHGKISENSFSCDYGAPLTALQAFGLGLILSMEARHPLTYYSLRLCAALERLSGSCKSETTHKRLTNA